jgi:hypothetical protein
MAKIDIINSKTFQLFKNQIKTLNNEILSGTPITNFDTGILQTDGTIFTGASGYRTITNKVVGAEGSTVYVRADLGTPTGVSAYRNVAFYDLSDNLIYTLMLTGWQTIGIPYGYKAKISVTSDKTGAVESGASLIDFAREDFSKILSCVTDRQILNGDSITNFDTGILKPDGTLLTGASSYRTTIDAVVGVEGSTIYLRADFGNPTGLSSYRNVVFSDSQDRILYSLMLTGIKTIGIPYGYKAKISVTSDKTGTVESGSSLEEFALSTEVDSKVDSKEGVNLANPDEIQDGYGIYSGGSIGYDAGWVGSYGVTGKIYFNGNSQLTCNAYASGVGFCNAIYDVNDNVLETQSTATITNVAGGVYAKFTVKTSAASIQVEYGSESTSFQKYSQIGGYLGQHYELIAYANGSDADTETEFFGVKNGLCAIQRAIDSCDSRNTYTIYCKGHFKFTTAAEFFLVAGSGYNYMVLLGGDKKNITLQGYGMDRTILEGFLPDNLGTGFDYDKYITLENNGDNCIVKDMSIICQNMRYPVHTDVSSGLTGNDHFVGYRNVRFYHKLNTNDALVVWASHSPFGLGISSGMRVELYGCELVCENNSNPLYVHDNNDFKKPFNFIIKNTKLVSIGVTEDSGAQNAFSIQMLGAGIAGNIIFENVDFGERRAFYFNNGNSSSVADLSKLDPKLYAKITGNIDAPLMFLDTGSKSKVLRVKSSTTGASSTVRFDKNSTAFPVMVEGLGVTDFTERSGLVHVDGYNYNDGAESLSGFARGELALDIGSIGSMAKRLGDRSSSSISLGIIIDGTTYTVTFNQDYTSYTEQQILDVINGVISGAGTGVLYTWGSDYHPEFFKCVSEMKNHSSYSILVGMGVKIDSNGIYPAESNSEVNAIALDDIKPGYFGRITKKELMYTYSTSRYYIKLASQGYVAKGTKFSIGSSRGIFELDNVSGILKAVFDSAVEISM